MKIVQLACTITGLIIVGTIMYGVHNFFTRFAEALQQLP